MSDEAEYSYEFSVWPHERGWEAAMYELFRYYPRVCIVLTETGFRTFRDSLERSGFTLREVTRVPHHDPEIVS